MTPKADAPKNYTLFVATTSNHLRIMETLLEARADARLPDETNRAKPRS